MGNESELDYWQKIALEKRKSLINALVAYKDQSKVDPIMDEMIAGALADAIISATAAHLKYHAVLGVGL